MIYEMATLTNLDIRLIVSEKGIYYKDIAAVLGLHHTSISRMMSKELKPKQREEILYAISCIEERMNRGCKA